MKKLNEKDLKKVDGGSTKITIRDQTYRSSGNGSHTIRAEFRTGGAKDGIKHRTAKNYKIPNFKQSKKR